MSNTWLTILSLDIDFWGPASNFGIPIAAIMDTGKDPEMYVSHAFLGFGYCFGCGRGCGCKQEQPASYATT